MWSWRKRILVWALVVTVWVGGLQLVDWLQRPTDGSSTASEAIGGYVAAINQRDVRALANLAGSGVDAEPEARQLIADNGGRQLVVDRSRLVDQMGSAYFYRLIGRSGSRPYERRLLLVNENDRWYVAIGSAKPDPRKPAAAVERP